MRSPSPAEYSGDVVPMCTTMWPATKGPSTLSITSPLASIRNTISARSKTSAGPPFAKRAPASGTPDRVQTTSSCPAATRLAAIGRPITPRPRNPNVMRHKLRGQLWVDRRKAAQ
jgi:hypothetical protein